MNGFRRFCLWFYLLSNPFGWVTLAVAIIRVRRQIRDYQSASKATAEYQREFRRVYGTDCLCEKPADEDSVFADVPRGNK